MQTDSFEVMLMGGHPNSLGRTVEVVELVLADETRFDELYNCYQSKDEVVRLRTSSAIKRVEKVRRDLVTPYLDRLIDEIGNLDQASAQWTLAQLFLEVKSDMTLEQQERAQALLQRNLANHDDWIVLNMTIKTLGEWAKKDTALTHWMAPHLDRLANDKRTSVSKKAFQTQRALGLL